MRAAYPETPVFRVEPNTPVEVRRGVLAFAVPDAPVDEELARAACASCSAGSAPSSTSPSR